MQEIAIRDRAHYIHTDTLKKLGGSRSNRPDTCTPGSVLRRGVWGTQKVPNDGGSAPGGAAGREEE